MVQNSCFQRYICNCRFFAVLIVCVLIGIGITYYVTNQENPSTNQNEQTVNGHSEASVDKSDNNNNDQNNNNNNANSNTNSNASVDFPKVPMWENNPEIEIFRDYLRIPTVHPNIDYSPAVRFLEKQAACLDLPLSIYYPVDDKNPVVVMTIEGSQPELPSIMLNSHMDVVPVFEEYWTYPPFDAEMDENGDIYARGAQDMKPNGMQYLAAIRALKREGVEKFKRTIHIVYVPDEELGGNFGMAGFVQSDEFKEMNVGFVLDEGSITNNDEGALYAYYGERTIWKVEFIVYGNSGHGSRLFPNTAGEKLTILLGKLNEFRDGEMKKLTELKYPYGNVTSINLTIIKGGVQNNVVPANMSAIFDMRISIDTDLDEFENQLNQWCLETGGNITINYLSKADKESMTVVDDSNPYYVAFKKAVDDSGILVKPLILVGGSDSRFIRRLNISAIGFSPQMNTTAKLHDHNEYLNAGIYLEGIEVYKRIITNLASV